MQHSNGLFGVALTDLCNIAEVDTLDAIIKDNHLKGISGLLKLPQGSNPVVLAAYAKHASRVGLVRISYRCNHLVDGYMVTGHLVHIQSNVQLCQGSAKDKEGTDPFHPLKMLAHIILKITAVMAYGFFVFG